MGDRVHAERMKAVRAWEAAKIVFNVAKQSELEAREAAIGACFTKAQLKKAGTYRCLLHDGSTVKLEIRRQAKVDPEKLPDAIARLKKLIGNVKGSLIALRLITYKPQASLSELAKLEADQAKLFEGVITIELGSPSLELIEAPCCG